MIVMAALVAAAAAGVPVLRLGLLAVAIYEPVVTAVFIGVVFVRAGRRQTDRAAEFCDSTASELRAGANLRQALMTAAVSAGSDNALDWEHTTLPALGESLAKEYPVIGPELSATVGAASRAGSDVAILFDEMGSVAIARSELEREVAIAVAPARVTAILLVGVPLVYLAQRMRSGLAGSLLVTAEQRLAGLLGLALFLAGLAAATTVAMRAGR